MIDKILIWVPRIISIAFAIFLMSFAFAEFAGGTKDMNAVIGFLVYSIPAIVVIMMLIVAWNWDVFGGILFMTAFVVITTFYGTADVPGLFMAFSMPLLLSGVLFMASGITRIVEALVSEKTRAASIPKTTAANGEFKVKHS